MPVGRAVRSDSQKLEDICRQHALPLTIQRRLILQALSRRTDHPTADQIFDDIRKEMGEMSRTTVYRVLETLVRVGLARKVCHPGAASRYEIKTGRHHHLVCLDCQAIVDLNDPSLDRLPLPETRSGFQVQDYSIQFRGLCSNCAAKRSTPRSQSKLPAAPASKGRAKSSERRRAV